MTTTYHMDFVNGREVVVQVTVQDGHVSVDCWSLDYAREILSDKQRLAADDEKRGDEADREGRADGHIFRASASTLFTQAHDLFVVLNGASGCVARAA